MIRAALIKALDQAVAPLSGRECAALASLPYKVAIDALGRMHDTGTVVRFGRKYSATWALSGHAAVAAHDAFGALEAVWHARRPPPPRGEGEATPTPHEYLSVRASKFFAVQNAKIFPRAHEKTILPRYISVGFVDHCMPALSVNNARRADLFPYARISDFDSFPCNRPTVLSLGTIST